MSTDPKVSIVIPVYNGSNFLREAIESALGQNYPHVEVIVVNDGSTDGGLTEAIAKSYGKRIRYLYKTNGGVSSALNLGIREMTGDWFAWLSHDDLFEHTRIEEDMRLVQKKPEARVVFCKKALIDEGGRVLKTYEYPPKDVHKILDVFDFDRGINLCTMTIHRSCIAKVGFFNVANKTAQDVEMMLRLAAHFSFYQNPNALTFIREHAQRDTHTRSEQHRRDLLLLSEYCHQELTIHDFFPEVGNDDAEIIKAWRWLGGWYKYLGAADYSFQCYVMAVAPSATLRQRVIKRLEFRAEQHPHLTRRAFYRSIYIGYRALAKVWHLLNGH